MIAWQPSTFIAVTGLLLTSACAAAPAPGPSHASTAPLEASPQCLLDEAPLLGARLAVVDSRTLKRPSAKALHQQTLGAELFLEGAPGWTASRLTREARCEIALYREGHRHSDADPLAVPGARVEVRERGVGFVLRVEARDASAARAIAERARAL